MKVVLINICLRPDVEKILYPVGLGYIAGAAARAGHDVHIIDMDTRRLTFEELEAEMRSLEFDAVGFGCIVTGYQIAKRLASLAKRVNPDAPVIVGNSVASSVPETLLDKTEVDIAVIGEGDQTIIELLDCLDRRGDLETVKGVCFRKDGRVVCTGPRRPWLDVDAIALPVWELFDARKYVAESKLYVSEPYPIPYDQIRAFPVNTARGCPFNCTFCYHVFRDYKYRYRSPEGVLDEVRELQRRYDINYVNFWDELTFLTLAQTDRLVSAILDSGLKFHWTASCRGDLFPDSALELAKKLKQAGCVGLGYSLESANAGILKAMNKKIDVRNYVVQKHVLDQANITSWTSLVIGYPEETEATLKETFDLCYENDIYPSAGFLLPQPGTPIYEYARQVGLIPHEEAYLLDMGDRQDLRLNLTRMSQAQLEECVNGHLRRIRDKLGLAISDQQLLKSGKYRVRKNTAGEK